MGHAENPSLIDHPLLLLRMLSVPQKHCILNYLLRALYPKCGAYKYGSIVLYKTMRDKAIVLHKIIFWYESVVIYKINANSKRLDVQFLSNLPECQ